MTKTALITGATGLLGRQVVKAFQRAGWSVIGTGLTRASPPSILKIDLTSESEIATVLQDTKPQVVVHCAANRFPDKCDLDPAGTRALNILSSGTLASLCAASSTLLLYISTDYVFPGTPGSAPYSELSPPQPTNLYGETKLEGEKAVLEAFESAGKKGGGVVLRVPVLYGEGERGESAVGCLMDAVWKAQEKDGNGEKVAMDHWAKRYPTNTEDVGRVCADIATHYLSIPSSEKATLPSVLHFSSEDQYTKYEICQLFAEIMGLPLDGMVANTEGNDPAASVQRPYDCHLESGLLGGLGISVNTMDFGAWWKREVRAFRK